MLGVTRHPLPVEMALERVGGPRPAAALAALEREVLALCASAGSSGTYEQRIERVLVVALRVADAGHPTRALDWLGRVDVSALGRAFAAAHANYEATLRVRIGDREGLRRVIARARRPAPAPFEDAFAALEALVDGMEGDAVSATERATVALGAAADSPSRMTWRLARAHGLARTGALDDAREELRSIRQDGGDRTLHGVAAQGGPASPLAEALLREMGVYR